jgi:hypothetical protein
VNERVSERVCERVGERVNEWVNERVNEWVYERVGEWVNEWVYERVYGWVNERVYERVYERVNEWVNATMRHSKVFRATACYECNINEGHLPLPKMSLCLLAPSEPLTVVPSCGGANTRGTAALIPAALRR